MASSMVNTRPRTAVPPVPTFAVTDTRNQLSPKLAAAALMRLAPDELSIRPVVRLIVATTVVPSLHSSWILPNVRSDDFRNTENVKTALVSVVTVGVETKCWLAVTVASVSLSAVVVPSGAAVAFRLDPLSAFPSAHPALLMSSELAIRLAETLWIFRPLIFAMMVGNPE